MPISPLYLLFAALVHAAITQAPATQPASRDSDPELRMLIEQQRRLARLRVEHEITQLQLAKALIAVELDTLRQRDAQQLADKEFGIALRRLELFREFDMPRRIAAAEQTLREAEDELADLEEELAAGERRRPPAGERVSRRRARLREAVERSRTDLKVLKERLLPQELLELEFEAEQKKRATLQVQRDDELPLLDRKIARLAAEAELARLSDEISDLEAGVGSRHPPAGARPDGSAVAGPPAAAR